MCGDLESKNNEDTDTNVKKDEVTKIKCFICFDEIDSDKAFPGRVDEHEGDYKVCVDCKDKVIGWIDFDLNNCDNRYECTTCKCITNTIRASGKYDMECVDCA